MFNKKKVIGFSRNLTNLKFKVGDILKLIYASSYGHWRAKKFIGRCISKKRKGNNTKVILRSVVHNICVEYDFFLYGSDVLDVKKISPMHNINTNRGKLYYLRRKNLNKSKVNQK